MKDAATLLSDAVAFAARVHLGQIDKAGAPYILHVLRVMLSVRGLDEQVAAVLHDTVEDAGISLDTIRIRFGDVVADAVDALTRRQGETYSDFIERCRENPIARVVKLADVADNMNLERLGREPTIEDAKRHRKYAEADAALRAHAAIAGEE